MLCQLFDTFPFRHRRSAFHPCQYHSLCHFRQGVFFLHGSRSRQKRADARYDFMSDSQLVQCIQLFPYRPVIDASPVWTRTVVPPACSVSFMTASTSSSVIPALSYTLEDGFRPARTSGFTSEPA